MTSDGTAPLGSSVYGPTLPFPAVFWRPDREDDENALDPCPYTLIVATSLTNAKLFADGERFVVKVLESIANILI